jgi:methionyl-tRNA formyltransferase
MKYIFFGSPNFAKIVLEQLLHNGLVPVAVVTNPDRPVGRKGTITPPLVKTLAEKNNIPVLQPQKLSESLEQLKEINADLFVVAAYAKIIPQSVLDLPKLGTLGVHPSLLPKYRGSSPIQASILGGEAETGVVIFQIDKEVDHGPVYAKSVLEITPQETYESLEEKLASLGGKLVAETIPMVENKEITPTEQDHAEATFTKKFSTEDGFINQENLKKALEIGGSEAIEIDRKVRALAHEPGVWTINPPAGGGKRMKIWKTKILSDGKLKLLEIQYEGKNRIFL